MAIITYDKNELQEYVPISQRGEKDPTVIVMKHLPFSEVERYSRMVTDGMQRGKQVDMQRVTERTRAIQREQFCDSIVEVRNYFVKRDGKLVAVKTADELYEVADNALITELIRAMESAEKLTEGQLKNFAAASGSNSDEARAS